MSDQGDRLARREGTRLWYRVEPGSQHEDHLVWEGHRHEAQLADTDEAQPRTRTGQLRSMQALRATLEQTETASPVPQRTEEIHALTGWRDSPRHCPVLLLSATTLLDARQPGPLLGPGTTYRIVSVTEGVVCLQVRALDGQVGLGYCNAVDLMCYEPEIMYMRPEKRTRRQTARLGLSRLSPADYRRNRFADQLTPANPPLLPPTAATALSPGAPLPLVCPALDFPSACQECRDRDDRNSSPT